MGRFAAACLLGAMGVLIWVTLDTNGYTAIAFSFVGHPLLVLGTVTGGFSIWRRMRS